MTNLSFDDSAKALAIIKNISESDAREQLKKLIRKQVE